MKFKKPLWKRKRKNNREKARLHTSKQYFEKSGSWYDEVYDKTLVQLNRFQIAFYSTLLFSILLLIAICLILPLRKTQLIVVHKNDVTGNVWLESESKSTSLMSAEQTKADIVRFVEAYESYSYVDYNYRYKLVNLLSSQSVFNQYQEFQSLDNAQSPLKVFGKQGVRQIKINSVMFLDNANDKNKIDLPNRNLTHHNLAIVNYVATEDDNNIEKQTAFSVLVSWQYLGMPSNPQAQLLNWNGFTVTQYQVSPRNV